jgi:tetratricopeptide (TPR) repeat protein
MALVLTLSLGVVRVPSALAEGEDPARTLYKNAQREYKDGQFEDALRDYSEAYKLKPLPGFFFDIAQCHRLLGHTDQAVFFYRRYLELAPHSANAPTAEALLKRMVAKQKEEENPSATPTSASPKNLAGDGKTSEGATTPTDEDVPLATPDARTAAETEAAHGPGSSANSNGVVANPPEPSKPLYKRWYVWASVGAVVVGGVALTYVLTRPATPSLGTVNAR